MAYSKALGCWGVAVGAMAGLVLLWLTLDLSSIIFGSLSGAGVVSLAADPAFHHQLGQYLVVVGLVPGVFIAVFRADAMPVFLRGAVPTFWAGAALNLLAWMRIASGVRWSTWALLLVVLGFAGPFLLRAIARATPSAAPPPTI